VVLLAGIKAAEVLGDAPAAASVLGYAKWSYCRCRSIPALRLLLRVEILGGLSGGFLKAFYMVMAVQLLNIGPAIIRLIIGLGGGGPVLGAVAAEPLERSLGRGRALKLALIFGRQFTLAIPFAVTVPAAGAWLLIAAQLFGDAALIAFGIIALSLRQQLAPQQVHGRIDASFHLVSQGALFSGTLLEGVLALWLPFPVVIWLGALIGLLPIPVIWRLSQD
jgi:hypothetical protein